MRRLAFALLVFALVATCAPSDPLASPSPQSWYVPYVSQCVLAIDGPVATVTTPAASDILCISVPNEPALNVTPGSYRTICQPVSQWVRLK
jgi:hypothetical protein